MDFSAARLASTKSLSIRSAKECPFPGSKSRSILRNTLCCSRRSYFRQTQAVTWCKLLDFNNLGSILDKDLDTVASEGIFLDLSTGSVSDCESGLIIVRDFFLSELDEIALN